MEVNDEYVEKEVTDVNDLQVLSDGVIGSHEALKRLASLERAKILVISDTHRNRDCCLKVIMEHGGVCDALFHLGDGVQDILYCVQVAFSDISVQKKLSPVIFIVEGNLDPHNCSIFRQNQASEMQRPEALSINFLGFLFVRVCKVSMMLTHGHLTNVKETFAETASFAKVRGCNFCFFGHLHQFCDKSVEGVRMINPGCLMRVPKQDDNKGFAIFEINSLGTFSLKHIKYEN